MSAVLDGLAVPVVQAPMAGGVSTVGLAAAVAEAGGLGCLAAGYRTAAEVDREIAALRRRSARPFAVNLFVPPARAAPVEEQEAYARRLRPVAAEVGVSLGALRGGDDGWDAKIALVERLRIPVVSFTFGCPPPSVVARLRRAGSEVWVTVTDEAEATAAREAGADALVAQGHEAGAHRGTFDDAAAPEAIGVLALVQLLRAGGHGPIVAAGGIATGGAVAAVLAAGAVAAQIGTALLLCPEAGTAPAHRAAIAAGGRTRLTRAFTGRQARAIENGFVRRFGDAAPSAYPHVHHLTAPLRAAARERGDAELMHLWAGQAHSLARAVPAAEVVAALAAEAREAVHRAATRLGAAEA